MGKMFPYKLLSVFCPVMLAGLCSVAQSRFAYRTALGPVSQTGFYTIPLPPRLVASCSTQNLFDLRIEEDGGGAVPYILQTDLPAVTAGSFTSYPILSNAKRDSSTELVISNEGGGPISSLLFVIKNASATRTAILSGSDNRQEWFVIDEAIALEQSGTQSGDRFIQAVFFPLSRYRYFKLILRDKGLLPLNILQAGAYKNLSYAGKYISVPVRTTRQTDSTDHTTYLRILFDNPYKTDKLTIGVKRPTLYKRSMEILAKEQGNYIPAGEGELNPGKHSFLFAAKTAELLVKIYNGDNPPLQIDSVAVFQVNQQLVAQLEKDKKYFILTGNAAAVKPDYDLAFFTDSISSQRPEIAVGPVVKNPVPAAAQPGTGNSKLLLWLIIGTVLLILLVLTVRMSKEIGKRPQT